MIPDPPTTQGPTGGWVHARLRTSDRKRPWTPPNDFRWAAAHAVSNVGEERCVSASGFLLVPELHAEQTTRARTARQAPRLARSRMGTAVLAGVASRRTLRQHGR